MNIEEIIENAVRKVVREEFESHKNKITTTLPRKNDTSIYGDIEWLMELKKVSRQTVYSWTHNKKIPYYKKGKNLLFNKHEIYEWINSGKMQTVEEIKEEELQELSELKNT
jgi:excisionase family DNA binding protein